jgi:hypothetical protein
VPTEASETVHQSIYRHYVFYYVFYHKKRVLYVFLEYRTFVRFESPSAEAASPTPPKHLYPSEIYFDCVSIFIANSVSVIR